MRAIIAMTAGLVLVCAFSALGDDPAVYDNNYTGPRNYYGQPTFDMYQTRQQQQTQPRPVDQGLFFQFGRGLAQVGGYVWGYMPAPVRGVENQYLPQPGQGNVNINFVPGSR